MCSNVLYYEVYCISDVIVKFCFTVMGAVEKVVAVCVYFARHLHVIIVFLSIICILWLLLNDNVKSSFLILFSFICLHSFNRVVGILLLSRDGSMCLLFGRVCMKILSLFNSCISCITFSCIRYAGALYVKSFMCCCVMGSVVSGFKVMII